MENQRLSFRMHIKQFEDDWTPFRKALRDDRKYAYDEVIDKMYDHAMAAHAANQPNPVEGMFLSVLVEQQKEIMDLQARLEAMESRTDTRPSTRSPRR